MGILQDRGFKVALLTDGRMSGASGKVPASIHMTPEALMGGKGCGRELFANFRSMTSSAETGAMSFGGEFA